MPETASSVLIKFFAKYIISKVRLKYVPPWLLVAYFSKYKPSILGRSKEIRKLFKRAMNIHKKVLKKYVFVEGN